MIKNLHRLWANSLFKNAVKLSSSNVLLYFLPLVVTPILSRIYLPETFGSWGIFSSTTVIITVFLLGCYEYVIVKASQSEIKDVIHLCLLLGGAIIIILFAGFNAGEYSGIEFFINYPSKNLLFIYLIISAGIVICQNYSNRKELYTLLATSYLILGLSQAFFRILFGLIKIPLNGLILGTVVAQGVGLLYMTIKLFKYSKPLFGNICFYSIKLIAYKYKNFPIYDAPASLFSFGAFNLPIIILSIYFSRTEIGCFSMIIQLLLMPMSFIGSAIGKVFYQQIAEVNNDPDIIHRKALSIAKLLTYLALLPALFILLGGDKIIVLFLGEKWHTAGMMALNLSIWSIPTIMSQPILSIYRNLDNQKRLLFYSALYFFAGAGSIWIGCYFGLPLGLILNLFAVCCFIAKIALTADVYKMANIKFDELPKPALLAMMLTVTLWGVRNFIL